jgi:hypothetical protein
VRSRGEQVAARDVDESDGIERCHFVATSLGVLRCAAPGSADRHDLPTANGRSLGFRVKGAARRFAMQRSCTLDAGTQGARPLREGSRKSEALGKTRLLTHAR